MVRILVFVVMLGTLQAASAATVSVTGIVLEADETSPAVLRTDITLPTDTVFVWPFALETTGDPPELAVYFNDNLLEQPFSNPIADGQIEYLVVDIEAFQGKSGEIAISLTASPGSTASLFLVQTMSDPVITTFQVTPSFSGDGFVEPSEPQTVEENSTAQFTLFPSPGRQIGSIGGDCVGTLLEETFTIGPINADCMFEVFFRRKGMSPAIPLLLLEETVP